MSAPVPLPENLGFVFRGERAWAPAQLKDRAARAMLGAANRCGRPNSDVLRRRLAVAAGEPAESWQVDFPAHFTAQEAALYEKPWAHLARSTPDWRDPTHLPALRRAISRVTRFLAMPVKAAAPDWRWIDDPAILPAESLVVVAREDDFTHGLLSSRAFGAWFAAFDDQLDPVDRIASFPFPWAPGTALGALTTAQEENRHAIARAARSGNADALESAVAAAYGWPADEDDRRRVESLAALAQSRSKQDERRRD